MSWSEWLSVPLGIGSEQWVTRAVRRTVAVVVHTLVSSQRLLDIVDLVESDPGVQTVFVRAPDVFQEGVSTLLRDIGALEVPWQQAIRQRFDLILAAAYGGLPELHGPIMVLPHGAGYAKRTPRSSGTGQPVERAVYGLGAEQLVQAGRVVPTSIVLSHEAQLGLLAQQCPPAAAVAVVAGDPCYDRLRASMGLRDHYRDALAVGPDQRLVVVASTWGRQSLFSQRQDVLSTLAEQLDPARNRIVTLVHPAAWSGHGRRQMRAWLTSERAAGVIVVEPDDDWRAVIVAADCVLGDHGSVATYAAAIGTPVIHIGAPPNELDELSPQAFVAARAPRWQPATSAESQLRHATHTVPATWADDVTARLTSAPFRSHQVLREEMYRLLDLPVPGRHRAVEPVEPPVIRGERRYA
jgi:hypothetical protein